MGAKSFVGAVKGAFRQQIPIKITQDRLHHALQF
jgi:hypothetical protein